MKYWNMLHGQTWKHYTKWKTDAEALILWPPDAKSQLIRKDPDAGKDWSQKEKGVDSMRWLYSITDSRDMKLNNLWETTKEREARAAAVHGVTKVEHNLATEQQQWIINQ